MVDKSEQLKRREDFAKQEIDKRLLAIEQLQCELDRWSAVLEGIREDKLALFDRAQRKTKIRMEIAA